MVGHIGAPEPARSLRPQPTDRRAALRGQSIVQPDLPTAGAPAVILLGMLVAAGLVLASAQVQRSTRRG